MLPVPIVVEALPRPFVAWALSPDRGVAATLGADGGLLLWRVDAKGVAHLERRIATPPWPEGGQGHPDAIALSLGGRYASVRRPDGGFDLWATAPSRLVRRVPGSKDAYAWRSAWSPAGDAVLLETALERTQLVRLDGRALDLPLAPPWSFTPDGKAVVGASGKGLALVDLASGRVRRHFTGPAAPLPPYVFSPDGRLLASAAEDASWKGPDLDPGEGAPTESAYVHELKIDVWRVGDGRLIRSLPGTSSSNADEARLFFRDARRLVVPDLGTVIDAPTGRGVGKFEPWVRPGATLDLAPSADLKPRYVRFPSDPDLGRNVAASPDGRTLVTGESGRETRLLVWDVASRRLLRRVAVPSLANLRSVAFAPDGRLVAEGTTVPASPTFETGRKRIEVSLNGNGGAERFADLPVATIPGIPRGLAATTLAPDGSYALVFDRKFAEGRSLFEVSRVDPRTGARLWTKIDLENPQGPVAISPDGGSFALAWIKGPLRPGMRTTLGVFDATTGTLRASVFLPGDSLWKSVFSSDGTHLLSATRQGIEVRDAGTLAPVARVAEDQDSGDVELAPLLDGGFAAVRRGRDLRLFDRDAHLLATLLSFPGSGWAAWTPEGKAWGSPEGLDHLRRPDGERLKRLDERGL